MKLSEDNRVIVGTLRKRSLCYGDRALCASSKPATSLEHQRSRSFLTGAHLCPTHFSRRGKKFSEGLLLLVASLVSSTSPSCFLAIALLHRTLRRWARPAFYYRVIGADVLLWEREYKCYIITIKNPPISLAIVKVCFPAYTLASVWRGAQCHGPLTS